MSDRKFLLHISALLLLLTAGFFPAVQMKTAYGIPVAKNTITTTGECDHNAREFLPVSSQLQICSTLPKSSRSEFQHHSFQFLPPENISPSLRSRYRHITNLIPGNIFIREISNKSISGRAGPFLS